MPKHRVKVIPGDVCEHPPNLTGAYAVKTHNFCHDSPVILQ